MINTSIMAPSTGIRIFLKTDFFLPFQKIRIHTYRIQIIFACPHKKAEMMEIRKHPFQSMCHARSI